jgi:hypothetical protein
MEGLPTGTDSCDRWRRCRASERIPAALPRSTICIPFGSDLELKAVIPDELKAASR